MAKTLKLKDLTEKFLNPFDFETENLGVLKLSSLLSINVLKGITVESEEFSDDEKLVKLIITRLNKAIEGNLTDSDIDKITSIDVLNLSKQLCKNQDTNDFIKEYATEIRTAIESERESLKKMMDSIFKPYQLNGISNMAKPIDFGEPLGGLRTSLELHNFQHEQYTERVRREKKLENAIDMLIKQNSGLKKWIVIAAACGTIVGGFSTGAFNFWKWKQEEANLNSVPVVIGKPQHIERYKNVTE